MTARAPARRVPVFVVAGALGAGKTTFVNGLLAGSDARVGVIVGDFGAVSVDAALVEGQVDDPVALAGGCLCCAPDSASLDAALERLAAPRLRLDAILLEASGVADPRALARRVMASAVSGLRFGGVVVLVDDTDAGRRVRDGLPAAGLADSMLVVLTKADLLPPGQLRVARAQIAERAPAARVVEASFGAIAPQLLFDAEETEPRESVLPLRQLAASGAPHGEFVEVTKRLPGPVHAGRLLGLLQDPPGGAIRVKGVVALATVRGMSRIAVHSVAGVVGVERTTRRADSSGSVITVVGREIDLTAAGRTLAGCVLAADEPDDRFAAGRLQRLVRPRRRTERSA